MVAKVFSDYDERPDPKKPGQQGVLFRKVAPAQDQRVRQHLAPEMQPGEMKYAQRNHGNPMKDYNKEGNWQDTRLAKGRVTGMVPNELYHGTISRAKTLKPGKTGNFDADSPHGNTMDTGHEHVFATGNMHDAYRYAKVAQDMHEKRTGVKAQAHVYRVQPTGSLQSDAEDSDTRAGYAEGLNSFQSKKPLRVMNEVQFSEAKEAYRYEQEEEMGQEPGSYQFAEKTPEQRYGW